MRNEEKLLTTLALVASEGYGACSRESSNSADYTRDRIIELARGDEGCRCTRENPDVDLFHRGYFGAVEGVRDR